MLPSSTLILVPRRQVLLGSLGSALLVAMAWPLASIGAIRLPGFVGSQILGVSASLFLVTALLLGSFAPVLRVSRKRFFVACSAATWAIQLAFFFAFGMLLVTEEELAQHLQILAFNLLVAALCGLIAWSLSRFMAHHQRRAGNAA